MDNRGRSMRNDDHGHAARRNCVDELLPPTPRDRAGSAVGAAVRRHIAGQDGGLVPDISPITLVEPAWVLALLASAGETVPVPAQLIGDVRPAVGVDGVDGVDGVGPCARCRRRPRRARQRRPGATARSAVASRT